VAPDAIPALLEQIDELLAEPVRTEEPASLAYLERTLTDGYAYALALEAERWRLEQEPRVEAQKRGEARRLEVRRQLHRHRPVDRHSLRSLPIHAASIMPAGRDAHMEARRRTGNGDRGARGQESAADRSVRRSAELCS
jgi:hypothetical protein